MTAVICGGIGLVIGIAAGYMFSRKKKDLDKQIDKL